MTNDNIEAGYSPIWDMQTVRNSCVIPERPLLIGLEEERDLNDIAIGIWRTLEYATDIANNTQREPFRRFKNVASFFPEGLSLPPVIRADVVKTSEGFKVVEIDPISAISLGETALLAEVWKQAGYSVIEPPTASIVDRIRDMGMGELSILVPRAKIDYTRELTYLGNTLQQQGIVVDINPISQTSGVRLSAFMEDPDSSKAFNKQNNKPRINPLWGSLAGLATKDALLDVEGMIDPRLLSSLPLTINAPNALDLFDADQRVVCKPIKSTGSRGIYVISASSAVDMKGYVAQELLEVVPDYFGEEGTLASKWVSRISIYAGRTGLNGVQVTARLQEDEFTNAHGQADAVQTAMAVIS